MTNQQLQIIGYIRANRVSTTEVADCLEKSGNIESVTAVNRGHFRVGPVHWAYAYDQSNWPVHEQIRAAEKDSVVVVSSFACGERAIVGDLVAKFLLLYRQCEALVVDGNVRDAHRLIKENWPVWSTGFNPVGCFNEEVELPHDEFVERERERYRDAIAVCDDTGVVIIPASQQNDDFLHKLEAMEAQEDEWYDCIDRRKWDTFETICLKKYETPQ